MSRWRNTWNPMQCTNKGCLLNYFPYHHVVFWTIPHIIIIMLSFELFLITSCCLLNYSSYHHVVFWTIPHIIMLSFERFLVSSSCCLLNYRMNSIYYQIKYLTLTDFIHFLQQILTDLVPEDAHILLQQRPSPCKMIDIDDRYWW